MTLTCHVQLVPRGLYRTPPDPTVKLERYSGWGESTKCGRWPQETSRKKGYNQRKLGRIEEHFSYSLLYDAASVEVNVNVTVVLRN